MVLRSFSALKKKWLSKYNRVNKKLITTTYSGQIIQKIIDITSNSAKNMV